MISLVDILLLDICFSLCTAIWDGCYRITVIPARQEIKAVYESIIRASSPHRPFSHLTFIWTILILFDDGNGNAIYETYVIPAPQEISRLWSNGDPSQGFFINHLSKCEIIFTIPWNEICHSRIIFMFKWYFYVSIYIDPLSFHLDIKGWFYSHRDWDRSTSKEMHSTSENRELNPV